MWMIYNYSYSNFLAIKSIAEKPPLAILKN